MKDLDWRLNSRAAGGRGGSFQPFTTSAIISRMKDLLEDECLDFYAPVRLAVFVWGTAIPWCWRHLHSHQADLLRTL